MRRLLLIAVVALFLVACVTRTPDTAQPVPVPTPTVTPVPLPRAGWSLCLVTPAGVIRWCARVG